jgi:2-polyprenyl-3-methyl-5-hydroxy-6-metoxy-1,4-benzoquinol methylase
MTESSHFGKPEYWEDYYNANQAKNFDWFQPYLGIKDIIFSTFDGSVDRSEHVILDVGCGSSELLPNLYLAGCSNLTGIDLNSNVINFVKRRDGQLAQWITCGLIRYGRRRPAH